MKDNTKKTLKLYLQATRHYPLSLTIGVLAVIGVSILNSIIPLFYKDFFNVLAEGGDKILLGSELFRLLFIIAFLNFAIWLLWRVNNFLLNYFESQVLADLAKKCFSYLHQHSFSYFNNNFVGSLVKKVNWFTRGFEGITDKIVYNIIPLVVNLVVIVLVLSGRHIWLALGILLWAVIFLLVNYFFTKYKLKYDIARNEAESENTAILADTITNNANVKLFNGLGREQHYFGEAVAHLRKLRRFTWDLGAGFDAIQGGLVAILEVGILYLAIRLWQGGVLEIGDFILIQLYIFNLINQVWNFSRVIRQFYESLSDAEEMTVILHTPHEIVDVSGAKTLKLKAGQIEFEAVDFNYNQTRRILNQLSLTIKPGESVALVGPSGSGKTTIVKLLLRMHDLTGGKIKIDGQNIAKVTQESLWQNISLVPQDPILFHRSLKENIRYGRLEATDEEVIEAAKKARCHDFIMKQKDGYDTFVGERGIKLSGGERQRVAIARTFLRNAPILVMDEATSSLDSESEHLIQVALMDLMKNKTVLVIAHRLSTIRHADRIIVIEQGQVVEEGTHNELSNQSGGLYSRLWQLQAGGFIK